MKEVFNNIIKNNNINNINNFINEKDIDNKIEKEKLVMIIL